MTPQHDAGDNLGRRDGRCHDGLTSTVATIVLVSDPLDDRASHNLLVAPRELMSFILQRGLDFFDEWCP